MRAMLVRVTLSILILSCLYSCSGNVGATKLTVLAYDGRVDLATLLPGRWDRVCVIGPYSTNEHAQEVVGASINIRGSDIHTSDNIALLVTLIGDVVSGLYDVSRRPVDFTELAGMCFSRVSAKFIVPDSGHPFAAHDQE